MVNVVLGIVISCGIVLAVVAALCEWALRNENRGYPYDDDL